MGVDPSFGKREKKPSGTEHKPAAKPAKDPKETSAQKRAKERNQSNANSTLSPRDEKEALRAQRDARTSKANDPSLKRGSKTKPKGGMSGAQSPDREDFNEQMLMQSERSASLRTKESNARLPGKRKAAAVQTGTELLVGLKPPVDSRSTATQTEVDKMELMEKELEALAKQSRQMYGLYGSKVELNKSGDIFFKGRGDFSATAKQSKDGYRKAVGVVYDEGRWE